MVNSMAGINYETELNDQLRKLNMEVDIDKGKVSSYYGIGEFMNKMCTCLDTIEEEMNNLKESFNVYNEAINNVPLPLSPEDVERSISSDGKYKYSKTSNNGGEII